MISKPRFVEQLRALGYRFQDQTKRVELWRRSGSTHRVIVPKCDELDPLYVRGVLRQCGMKERDIAEFLAEQP